MNLNFVHTTYQMDKKDYEIIKSIKAKETAGQPTTFAERNKRNMIMKKKRNAHLFKKPNT